MKPSSTLRLPVTLTPESRQAVRGKLKALTRTRVVVSCDTHLPRHSHCELVFKLASTPERERSIKALCKVEENVHAAMGFDIYLKIDRIPDSHSFRILEQLVRG